MRGAGLVGALVLLAVTAVNGKAQDRELVGTLVDEAGAPIAGAMVGLIDADRHVLTDAAGVFRVRDTKPGEYRVLIDVLGYDPFDQTVVFDGESDPKIHLRVRPISLEAIEVQVDRLEARRQQMAVSSQVFDTKDLEDRLQSPAAFLRGRAGMRPMECDYPTGCLSRRGRGVALRLFLDDNAISAIWSYLETYPPELLARIETFPDCGMIRLYSKRYLEYLVKIGGRTQHMDCIKDRTG